MSPKLVSPFLRNSYYALLGRPKRRQTIRCHVSNWGITGLSMPQFAGLRRHGVSSCMDYQTNGIRRYLTFH